ncbi:MAG: hypothetical protein ACKOD3_06010 [Phenylobacterium sp.]
MTARIDTSRFPVGKDVDYEGEEERVLLAKLTDDARRFVDGWRWDPPVSELVLAFAVAPILGLFLMRFAPGGRPQDAERWVVVGDLPAMHFETDEAHTPARALELICAIAHDWADGVRAGRDLSDSYPFPIPATQANADRLLDRVAFLRERLIPRA